MKAKKTGEITKKETKTIDVKIAEFLNDSYSNYAIHTLENRAIPSCIDGMKPIHRKIYFTALNNVKVKENKVTTLAGKVMSETMYHNGNIPCEEAIVGMTQKFKNNIPYFDGIGQFGELKNPFYSSSRYLAVKLSKEIQEVFKDEYLLEYRTEDSVKVEPFYYLPLIPLVIINGSSGIALGYSTKILNRNPSEVITRCLNILNDKKYRGELKPLINGFNGEIIQDKENPKKWIFNGTYEIVNSFTIRITEIPPSTTLEKYEAFLEDLIDKKEINSYENNSSDKVDYLIKISRDKLSSLNNKEDIMKFFKLTESVTEFYTTLNEKGKLKIFNNIDEIIEYFINFRLTYYEKRKEYLVNKLSKELFILENKLKFVQGVLKNDIIINNKKKQDIIINIEKMKISKIEDSYDYLLKIPIYNFTYEMVEELKENCKKSLKEIERVKEMNMKEVYIEELTSLKKMFK